MSETNQAEAMHRAVESLLVLASEIESTRHDRPGRQRRSEWAKQLRRGLTAVHDLAAPVPSEATEAGEGCVHGVKDGCLSRRCGSNCYSEFDRMHPCPACTPAEPDAGEVEALAKVLADHAAWGGEDEFDHCECGWTPSTDEPFAEHRSHVATVLAARDARVRRESENELRDALIARLCDCGDFDGHPGDCAATPVITIAARIARDRANRITP